MLSFIAIILIIAIAVFLFLRITKPSDEASRADVSGKVIKEISDRIGFDGVRDPIDVENSHISFKGFGPGKSHVGNFKSWGGDLFLEKGKIVGFDGIIKADSIDAKINQLTNHLKSKDFLNAEKYSKIKFVSKKLSNDQLTGDLTFLGITREIIFPVTITEESISADFVLDTSQFGKMSDKANKEVRIFFKLVK